MNVLLKVGDVCQAKFPDDGKWYTGKIASIKRGTVVVNFDDGDKAKVPLTDVRAKKTSRTREEKREAGVSMQMGEVVFFTNPKSGQPDVGVGLGGGQTAKIASPHTCLSQHLQWKVPWGTFKLSGIVLPAGFLRGTISDLAWQYLKNFTPKSAPKKSFDEWLRPQLKVGKRVSVLQYGATGNTAFMAKIEKIENDHVVVIREGKHFKFRFSNIDSF